MNGCLTCGGFGNRHDPIAHDAEPDEAGWTLCVFCDGTGSLPDADHPCGECGGSGEVDGSTDEGRAAARALYEHVRRNKTEESL